MKKQSSPFSSFWPDGYIPPAWLPDWRDEAEYTRLVSNIEYSFDRDTKQVKSKEAITSKREFAWEFLRRNPFYQADYDNIYLLAKKECVLETYEAGLGINIFRLDDTPPPSMIFHTSLYRVLQKWKFGYYLMNPALDVLAAGPLPAITRLGDNCSPAVNVEYAPISLRAIAVPDAYLKEPIPVDGGIIPTDTEIFWLFDVSLPIEPQLQRAKEHLNRQQLSRSGKKVSASKTSISDYIRYLRLLDAEAKGKSTPREIADILRPGKTQYDPPDMDGFNKDHAPAYELRNTGYRRIF